MAIQEIEAVAPSPAVKFGPRRIGHANIYIGDRDRSVAFYRDLCGFEIVGTSKTSAFLSNGNSHHDFGLCQADGKPRVGADGKVKSVDNWKGPGSLNHIGWETDNQAHLAAAYQRALEGDVEIKRSLYHGGSWALYLFDPEGNYHEFYADATLAWREIFDGGDVSSITSHWDPSIEDSDETPYWDPNPEWVEVDGAAFHPLRASRTMFYVDDMPLMVDWFENVAGFELAHRANDDSYAYFAGAARQTGFDIALLRRDSGQRLGYQHVSCQMPDETSVDRAEQALAARGIEPVISIDNDTKRSFFLNDPDGLGIELFVERSHSYDTLADVESSQRPYYV